MLHFHTDNTQVTLGGGKRNGIGLTFMRKELKETLRSGLFHALDGFVNHLVETVGHPALQQGSKHFLRQRLHLFGIQRGLQKEGFFQTLTSLGRIMDYYADEQVVSTASDTIFELIKGY